MIAGKSALDPTFDRQAEAERYKRVDDLVARGSCRCRECGRGTANHAITLCSGCGVKISRELEAMGWGDWLAGGPAPTIEREKDQTA